MPGLDKKHGKASPALKVSRMSVIAVRSEPDHETGAAMKNNSTPAPESHILQFYDSRDFLCEKAVDFLIEGAREGRALMMVVTKPHFEIITAGLRENGVGMVTTFFVDDLIPMFTSSELGDEEVKKRLEGIVTAAAGPNARVVQIYGELADALISHGQVAAALRSETLWNEVAATHPLSILCAHALENFYDVQESGLLVDVCRLHGSSNPAV